MAEMINIYPLQRHLHRCNSRCILRRFIRYRCIALHCGGFFSASPAPSAGIWQPLPGRLNWIQQTQRRCKYGCKQHPFKRPPATAPGCRDGCPGGLSLPHISIAGPSSEGNRSVMQQDPSPLHSIGDATGSVPIAFICR